MKSSTLVQCILLLAVAVSFSSCDKDPQPCDYCSGSFKDSRDGKWYHSLEIGTQIWMAENLAYLPTVNPSDGRTESEANYYVSGYEGDIVAEAKATDNYTTYGVLYNWPAALTACPDGWHLPTNDEWTTLINFLGNDAGGKIKEAGNEHWEAPNAGATNESKFTALPGGYKYYSGGFSHLTLDADFWSASDEGWDTHAWYLLTNVNDSRIAFKYDFKSYGFSVRCIARKGS